MKILFHLPHTITKGVYSQKEDVPRELYYGSDILAKVHEVDLNEDRFSSLSNQIPNSFVRHGLALPSLSTIKKIFTSDLIIIKDHFSISISLLAKIAGTKVIYIDAMFELPKRNLTKTLFRACVKWSYKTISFSETQNSEWITKVKLPTDKLHAVPFCIDFNFYEKLSKKRNEIENNFLAIGRDPGRDYVLLTKVFAEIDAQLDLVTMPYLLPLDKSITKNVRLSESIPYDDISDLYAKCTAHIIPLKSAYTYPSGIRAILEAIAFKVPVISTRTPVLNEFFKDLVHFIEPGDENGLSKLLKTWNDKKKHIDVESIHKTIRERHDYAVYCDYLLGVIDQQ